MAPARHIRVTGIGQDGERRLRLGRPERDGKSGDMARDRGADLRQGGEHRARAADAVEAHHIGAGVLEPLARLPDRPALEGGGIPVQRERHHGWKSAPLDLLERVSASAPHEMVSAMTKSTPASAAQPTCSSNIARTAPAEASSPVKTFVLEMLPARSVPVSAATCFAISSARRLSGSSRPPSRSRAACRGARSTSAPRRRRSRRGRSRGAAGRPPPGGRARPRERMRRPGGSRGARVRRRSPPRR